MQTDRITEAIHLSRDQLTNLGNIFFIVLDIVNPGPTLLYEFTDFILTLTGSIIID